MSNNYPPGCTDADISRRFDDEDEESAEERQARLDEIGDMKRDREVDGD